MQTLLLSGLKSLSMADYLKQLEDVLTGDCYDDDDQYLISRIVVIRLL